MTQGKLKLAILTGRDSAATWLSISMLADLPQVQIVAILFDSQPQPLKGRLRGLLGDLQGEGGIPLPSRVALFIHDWIERQAARLVCQTEVRELLRQAFPERLSSLADLGRRYQIPILEVGGLNGPGAAEALRQLDVDLGVVMGTRISNSKTLSIPRLGCITLRKGTVPEQESRGYPSGYWEFCNGQISTGVTVLFADGCRATGDVVGEDSVPIHPDDTPEALGRRLDVRGGELLSRCVADLAEARAERGPQPLWSDRPRTPPTRLSPAELNQRLGRSSQGGIHWGQGLKTIFYLTIYYTGLFHLVRFLRHGSRGNRACILLYHRINDLVDDWLTTSVERFAEHMVTLRRYYSVISSVDLVRRIKSGERLPPNSLVIHFDDCYRDVYTHASRILSHIGLPACSFVSSGYVDTDRGFPHDAAMYPLPMENLTSADLMGLAARGIEIGSHTVNHADLAQCDLETAATEVMQSKVDLERILGRPVPLFSYPFGGKQNMRSEVVELVQRAGYEAMFSAYGGYVTEGSDPFNLPRVGVSNGFRPLDLLMTIEGLSVTALKGRWQGIR